MATVSIFLIHANTVFAYGYYVGFSAGYNNTKYQLKDSTDTVYNINTSYPIVGLFAGNGTRLDKHLYLGGEVFLNIGSNNTSTQTINNNFLATKIYTKYAFGIDVLPGYALNDKTLFYARVGMVKSDFQLKGNVTQAGIDAGIVQGPASPIAILGARFGLGVRQALNKSISLRGEWVYSAYQKRGILDNAGIRDFIHPKMNQLNVAVAYEFA